MYNFVKDRLIEMSSCLKDDKNRSKLIFSSSDKSSSKDIIFEKRIGSDSVYGEIYKVSTKNTYRDPPTYFMSKVMKISTENTNEIIALNKVSEIAFCEGFVNFPLIYAHLRCDKKCSSGKCPRAIQKDNNYYTFFSELANRGDLQTFLKTKHTAAEMESIILQIMYTVYIFHRRTGFAHNDMHLGNILIHEVKPGGSFTYKIGDDNKTVQVTNRGHIVILWDFGKVTNIETGMEDNPVNDYFRPLKLLRSINDGDTDYKDWGLKYLPNNIYNWINDNLNYPMGDIATEHDYITKFPFVKLKK